MSELIKTAPEKIYLCVSDDESSRDESFPYDCGEVTWSEMQSVSVTLEYVRSDKAIPAELRGKILTLCTLAENGLISSVKYEAKQLREMMGEA